MPNTACLRGQVCRTSARAEWPVLGSRGTAGWRRPAESVNLNGAPTGGYLLSGGLLLLGRVDPGGDGELRRGWGFADEPLGVSGVRGGQDVGALGLDDLSAAVVDV